MKILIINYAYFITGGSERYMFNVSELFKKHGHEIIHYSMLAKENYKCKQEEYFASSINDNSEFYYKTNTSTREKLKYMIRTIYSKEVEKKLDNMIKDNKPDVAYVLNYHKKLSPAVLVACTKNNIPVFSRLSDYLIMCPKATFYRNGNLCELCKRSKLYSIKYKCVKNSYKASIIWYIADKYHHIMNYYQKINAFIATNEFMKDKLIEYGYNNDIYVINTYAPKANIDIVGYNKKREINQIVFIGTIYKEIKGIELLMEAYKKIKDIGYKVKLIVIGRDIDNIIKNKYIHMINNNEIVYNKHINHADKHVLLKALAESMYCIYPAKIYENFPNVILESYSVGTPVIGTNIGSLRSMIKDGETGYHVDYNSVDDLCKVIIKGLNITEKAYTAMQNNCISQMEKCWDEETHYSRIIEMVKKYI